jgi:uncharacterized protein YvpB
MIAVQHPGTVVRRPRARHANHLAPVAAWARALARRTTALVIVVVVLNTVGGSGLMVIAGSPFELQSRATALQARWTDMVAQGVPPSDLAALQQELAGAQRIRFLAVGSPFWWPDSSGIINGWQARTDAIWDRNLTITRSGAVAADERLRQALGVEPVDQRKEHIAALKDASTPADFLTLSSDWDLEATLVPIDRAIAALVGKVVAVSQQAKAIGIVTYPGRDVLVRAQAYALEDGTARSAHAHLLLSNLTGLEQDIRARIAAATITKSAFGRAAHEISVSSSYGVSVSSYQARVDADRRSYSTAARVGVFKALTGDLTTIAAQAHHAGQVALAAMHNNAGASYIIGGVPFYYQIHSLSCEETATSMALLHQGLRISQDQILARLGSDSTPAWLVNGRVVRWGDPDKAFVGNVNGSESNYTGQQANPKALVRVLNSFGARIIEWSEPGVGPNVISAQEIYRQVAAGHPVVAYATWDWNWHPIYYYTSEDGNRVPLISPANDHVYTVIGVSPTRVLVNDPIRGQYWVSRGAFEASYEFGMAIVLA